jgi:hypothetical protein
VAAGCWSATSSRPAMSRSASRRVLVPLVVLVLTLRVVLDRLFADLKLVGVMGARMVDRTDCRERDPVKDITNKSGGYTGSTGIGELGTPPDVSVEAGLDGTRGLSRGLGRVVRRV